MCRRLRRHVVRRERLLQDVGCVLRGAVLYVIHMPGAHRLAHAAFHHRIHPPCVRQVPRRAGHNQNRIHARQRHHLHLAGQRTAGLRAERLLQGSREILRRPVRHRQQRIRLAGQHVDVEGAHQLHQRVALRRLAADDQRVAGRNGHQPGAALYVGLQHLGQVLGRCVAQRHQHAAGRTCAASHAGGQRRGQHAVHPAVHRQRGAVLRQQGLQHRDQLALRQRRDGAQGGRAMHGRVDRVVHVQRVAQNLRHHLTYVGVGEIQRDAAAGGPRRARPCGHQHAGPVADRHLQRRRVAGDAAVHARRGGIQPAGQRRQGRQQPRLPNRRAAGSTKHGARG